MAVPASSWPSNWTTPVPRERPFGSYWISALLTLPMVVNNSMRSSLLVDQGSYAKSALRLATKQAALLTLRT